MAKVGDTLTIQKHKQTIRLLQTAQETQGKLLEMEASYAPAREYPPEHLHPEQDERFEVKTGRITVRINGQERHFSAGQSIDIPRGTAHTFRNGGDQLATVLWQIRPALGSQQFYETLSGLVLDGKTNHKGLPNILQMAVILRHYRQEFRLTKPQAIIQTLVFLPLALIGRLCGYRPEYERYSGKESRYFETAL